MLKKTEKKEEKKWKKPQSRTVKIQYCTVSGKRPLGQRYRFLSGPVWGRQEWEAESRRRMRNLWTVGIMVMGVRFSQVSGKEKGGLGERGRKIAVIKAATKVHKEEQKKTKECMDN